MYRKTATRPYGFCGIFLLLLLVTAGQAAGQETRNVRINDMFYNTSETLGNDDINWPTLPWFDGSMLESHGIIVGTRRTWTDPTGVVWNVQVAQIAQNKSTDIEKIVVPVKGAFKRVFRNPHPLKVLDGVDRTQTFDVTDPTDGSIPSDVMVYVKANGWPASGMGIQIERWLYFFSNPDYQDFTLQEWVITNTSGEVRNDVYVGLTAETSAHTYYPADLWGTYYGATYKDYVAGDAGADSLRMYYSWDADRTTERPNEDTKGDPQSTWGVLQEPQYFGFAVVHADKSATDESDDPAQPFKAGWSQRELSPDLNVSNQQGVYTFISTPWRTNPGDDRYATYDPTNYYRVMIPTLTSEDLHRSDFDPTTEQEKTALLSFGPYTLQAGQDVRIVTALVGGTIPNRLSIDAGKAYRNGATSQVEVVPLPNEPFRDGSPRTYGPLAADGQPIVRNGDVYDLDGNLIAAAGSILTRQQKDRIVDMGEQLVARNAAKAIRVWNNSTVKSGQGAFNVPFAPASPSLNGFSENDRVRLTWSDNQQDPRGGPITGYRIYRDYKRPASIVPTDTNWVQIAGEGCDKVYLQISECPLLPAGTTEFIDTEVVRGENYYYYITAVNDRGIESSPYLNRTGTSANRQDEALNPTRAPDNDWKNNVVVVPNPYHPLGAKTYGGRRLNFLNLPPYANIHIYTITGDRVQTIKHNSDTGDEDWERQDTFSTMEVVSGVYLYVVEETDQSGNATGEQAIGKFVVIK